MRLYDLGEEWIRLQEDIEAGNIPEDAIADTVESLGGELADKLDAVTCVIKNFAADEAALRAEAKTLADRANAAEKRRKRLEGILVGVMRKTGQKGFKSVRNDVSFRRSTAVVVDNEDAFVAWAALSGHDALLKYRQPEISKTAIKAAIASGEQIPGARIAERLNLQIK